MINVQSKFCTVQVLVKLFSKKSLSVLTASRMQHYVMFLSAFAFDIKYKLSEDHCNADAMSRLPLSTTIHETYDKSDVFEVSQIETLPLTASIVANETQADKSLQHLFNGLRSGNVVYKNYRFNLPQTEFSLQQGAIFRGHQILILQSLRKSVLDELHTAHFEKFNA